MPTTSAQRARRSAEPGAERPAGGRAGSVRRRPGRLPGRAVTDPYTVQFRPSAAKALGKLDGQVRARILRSITALADDPRPSGVKALTGKADRWRIRVGDYSIVCGIEDGGLVVLVVLVAHRSTVYQRR